MENEEITAFLLELYHATGGDAAVKKSMHELGATIGLDKEHAGKMAEELIGRGWAEIKTLSGGIGITAEGVEAAHNAGAAAPGGNDPSLGAGPLLSDDDRRAVETLLARIKQGVAKLPPDYAAMEEMVIDIKTAEVHLLSPRARTSVIKEILDALRSVLADAGARVEADRIGRMLGQ